MGRTVVEENCEKDYPDDRNKNDLSIVTSKLSIFRIEMHFTILQIKFEKIGFNYSSALPSVGPLRAQVLRISRGERSTST